MARSLSNLVNNVAERIHKIKCKYVHYNKNLNRVRLYTNITSVLLNIQMLKMIS